MFLSQDPPCQCMCIVALQYRNSFLHHDHSMVQAFIHKVNSAPRQLHSIGKCLLLRVQSRKRRQQRRMNIQDSIWKRGHKLR